VTTPPEPPQGDSPAEKDAQDAPPAGRPEDAAEGLTAPPQRRRRTWLRVLAVSTALLVLAGAGGLWYVYQHLNGNITTDNVTETELKAQEDHRPAQEPTAAENILLIGSDNRGNGNEKYGQDSGTQRSDTTILLHLSADRSNATAMSIPRDLMAHVPECTKPDGSTISPKFEQFNWAFEAGGAACTIRTVEEMTGVRVDHHLIVDFSGFKKMVDAVDGVEVCLANPVHDVQAHLDLPAGRQKLDGEQALGFVRARHGFGDGSDTERIGRQQDFLASLVKKVQSNGVLLNPVKLYPLLDSATKSLTADPGLNSLSELYKLAQSLQKVPAGQIHFLTVPREPYVEDHNRDQLVQPDADRLFAAVRADQAIRVTSGPTDTGAPSASTGSTGSTDSASSADPTGSAGSTSAPSSTPSAGATSSPGAGSTTAPGAGSTSAPTFHGTTADRDICGKDQ
jgi:LCP family protein required for cell wall assembly